MDIEQLAVAVMKQRIGMCPNLKALLDDNDKTPLTDGHIDVYENGSTQTNETLRWRVPAQVKGRVRKNGKPVPNTYRVKRVDLKGYRKFRGVLYLVVDLDEEQEDHVLQYAVLTPYKLQGLLNETRKAQKTVTIRLKKLPTAKEQIEQIVRFAGQAQREDPSLGMEPRLLEDASELMLYTTGQFDLDVPVMLRRREHDFSLVVKTREGMAIPIDAELQIIPDSYVGRPVGLPVSSDSVQYTDAICRRIDRTTNELELSLGLKIRIPESIESESAGAVSFTGRSGLLDRLDDLTFLFECYEGSGFTVGSTRVGVQMDSMHDESELRAHLQYLQRLKRLLDHLGADAELVDLDGLTPSRADQLMQMYRVIFEQAPTTEDIGRFARFFQPIGDWGLDLVFLKDPKPGESPIQSLFDPNLALQLLRSYEDGTEGTRYSPATPYDLMEEEYLSRTLNLRLDNLVDAYRKISEYPGTPRYANQTVLALIKAADSTGLRRDDFLAGAMRLTTFLIEEYGPHFSYLINRWQLRARMEGLTSDDRDEVRDLKRSAVQNELEESALVAAACATLLGDDEDARYWLRQVDEKKLADAEIWPIWTLLGETEGLSADNWAANSGMEQLGDQPS